MPQIVISAENWMEISALLDEALDLPAEARTRWLQALDLKHAPHRPTIEALLQADVRAQTEHFLETLPKYSAALLSESSATGQFVEGAEVGPYRLARELGRGGMGTVWVAHRTDGALKRPVALKILRAAPLDRQFLERFARERDILAGLTHPNIARLYDAGVTETGQPYLALELVEGEALTGYANAHHLGVRERIALVLQVLDAVQYAHRNLVIHRDLKPGNILVSADHVVHLLDFGIAKLLPAGQAMTNATELTEPGGRALTPDYASPEQITGGPISTASDVYSLAVILYELVCGQRPYRLKRSSRAELEEAILTVEPALPSRALSGKEAKTVKGDLDTIVLKALRKDPADRYPTAEAFSRDLRHFLNREPVEARPYSRLYRLSTFVNRHRLAVSLATVVMATILASLGFALVQMREARAQRDAAVFEVKRAEASLQLTSFLVGEARVRPGDRAIVERLEKSRELIRRQFADEPSVRAELLFEIADRFVELRDLKALAEVMAEIGALARETDLPWLQARYRCATAELKMNEGESEAAGVLMQEAFVQLERQRPPQFAALVECMIDDAYLASLTGDSRRAIERGQQAARLHEERGLTNTNSYAKAWSGLTTAYSFAGDVRNGLAATRKERDTYVRLGQDDTFSYLTSLFLEATFLNRGGRRAEALARSSEALERSKARGLPDNHTQLVYRGIILLGMAQPDDALELFDRAAREFVKQKMRFDELQVHMWASDALLQRGDVRAARARLDPHWPAIEAQLAAKNASMTKGLRVRAQLLQAEGRVPEARDTIERAVAIVTESKSATYTGASAIFRTAAEVALATGSAPQALAHIGRAIERSTRDAIDPAASADLGELLLTRAGILRALGRASEADADDASALRHVRDTLPPDHPLTRRAAATLEIP